MLEVPLLSARADWMCLPHDIYGFKRRAPGAMGDNMIYSADALVHKVPGDLPPNHAAFAEPLACSLQAVERAGITFGDTRRGRWLRSDRSGHGGGCTRPPSQAERHDDGKCSVAWCSARDIRTSTLDSATGRLAGVLIRIGQEAISDAWLSDQVSRPAGLRLQLAAQISDMHSKVVGLCAIPWAPYLL